MEKGPLSELLLERYEDMPPQLKIAARFVLDHPEEVALSSMREQAAQAGVSHSTMMRLARWLGMDGYEDMRSSYAQALRTAPSVEDTSRRPAQNGERGMDLAAVMADSAAAQISRIGELLSAERMVGAAKIIAAATAVFVLGAGPGVPAAQQFLSQMTTLFPQLIVRDVQAVGGIAALSMAPSGSVLVAIGSRPYDRALVGQVERASSNGVDVVAITDSAVSPLARVARASMNLAPTTGAWLRSALPTLAAVEILAALVAAEAEIDIGVKFEQLDERLQAFDVLWKPTY